MWTDLSRGCRLPFARPPFQREEDIFPVSRKSEDMNIFSSIVPTFSSVWSLVFYSHALFVILFLHLLFAKLTKRVSNSSEKRWQLLCTLNLSSLSEWRPRTFSVYYVYLTSVKNEFIWNQIKTFMSPLPISSMHGFLGGGVDCGFKGLEALECELWIILQWFTIAWESQDER